MRVYHIVGFGKTTGIAAGLSLAVLSSFREEVLFRGILFRLSSPIIGTWRALLLTSALFGLAHLGNTGATFSSGVAIMLEAGVLLGAAYVLEHFQCRCIVNCGETLRQTSNGEMVWGRSAAQAAAGL
jgi:membrane protease YdiL (CAAX protease family)